MAQIPTARSVSVAPVTPALAGAVRALRVAPEQYAFVGDVAVHLIDCEACAHSEPMAILADGTVVGFYRLDLRSDGIGGCEDVGACALLRNLQLDRGHQGRGLATRAVRACVNDLELRHPSLRLLVLQVDCINTVALHVYRRTGFVDTGRFNYGGRSGPQRLMFRSLGARDNGARAA